MSPGRPPGPWTTHEVLIEYPISHLPEHERQAWLTWLAQHQLDPCMIPLDQWIVADDPARTVTVDYFVLDAAGCYVAEERDGWPEPKLITHVVQLEAPALPMPDSHLITRHIYDPTKETA